MDDVIAIYRQEVADLAALGCPYLQIDEIRPRLDDASRYISLDQLCISPQCGFASSYQTNRFTHDDQERKLAHMVNIVGEMWG